MWNVVESQLYSFECQVESITRVSVSAFHMKCFRSNHKKLGNLNFSEMDDQDFRDDSWSNDRAFRVSGDPSGQRLE